MLPERNYRSYEQVKHFRFIHFLPSKLVAWAAFLLLALRNEIPMGHICVNSAHGEGSTNYWKRIHLLCIWGQSSLFVYFPLTMLDFSIEIRISDRGWLNPLNYLSGFHWILNDVFVHILLCHHTIKLHRKREITQLPPLSGVFWAFLTVWAACSHTS